MKTIKEVQTEQRAGRPADVDIALQDFLDLPQVEQMEMLFSGLLDLTRQVEWCKDAILRTRR